MERSQIKITALNAFAIVFVLVFSAVSAEQQVSNRVKQLLGKIIKTSKEARKNVSEVTKETAEILKQVAEEVKKKVSGAVSDVQEKAKELKADPFIEVKKIIRKQQFAIAHNPYKNRSAKVRQGPNPVSDEEISWRKKRFKFVKKAQEKFLGIKHLADDEVLEIGFSLSGGGFRAMLGALGSLKAAHDAGLLDCVMCMSGLSGSTWFMGPWIASGLSLEDYKKSLLQKLRYGLTPSPRTITNLTNNLLVKFACDQQIRTVDLYGNLLANTLLGNDEANYTCLATTFPKHQQSVAKRIADARKYPFPVFTAVVGDKAQEWIEFTPYEIGCRVHGYYIPTWALGRAFDKGKSTDYSPEQTLGFCMGTFGSAYCFNLRTAYGTILPWLIKLPFLGKVVNAIGLELVEPVVYTPVGDIRFAYAAVNNFMFGLPGSAMSNQKIMMMVDAGMVASNPIPAVYRKTPSGGAPDIIIACDYGASGLGAKELKRSSVYFATKVLPFPELSGESKEWGKHALTMFGDAHNMDVPMLFYMPRIKDNALIEQYRNDPRFGYYIAMLDPLDWNKIVDSITGYANTINMIYTPEQAETVCAISEFNMLTQIETIKAVMKERVLAKRLMKNKK